jgi:hypothetical protein
LAAAGRWNPPYEARTVFDPTLGYPVDVYFDYQASVADEEWGFQVTEFAILS